MVVVQEFKVGCVGCHKEFVLYEYVGLEGGLYSNHFCDEVMALELKWLQGEQDDLHCGATETRQIDT